MRIAATALYSILLVSQLSPARAGFSDDFRAYILGNEPASNQTKPASISIDTTAQGCLMCHDGSRASHISLRQRGSPLQIRGSQTLNHPIGMDYDESVRRDPQGYRALSALHPNIQLVNGQVTCVSCHQLRSTVITATTTMRNTTPLPSTGCTATKALTTGQGDRALCLACHIK